MKKIQRAAGLFFLLFAVLLPAQEGSYDWRLATELFPGVLHAFLNPEKPRIMKINVIRIDLSRPEFYFVTTGRAEEWGRDMPDCPGLPVRVRRQTTRDFLLEARKNGTDMIVAVNASPWRPWKKPWTHRFGCQLGLVISNGELVDYPNNRPAFLLTKDGKYQIRELDKKEDLSKIRLAAAGFAMILKDGMAVGGKDLQPRTAYGLTKDGKYLFLLTLDGRMKGISEGAGTLELGRWLKHFGAWTGINMDGGGSTTLVVPDLSSKNQPEVRRLNHAVYYRRVANSLGLCRKQKP